jgi:hypothetical protein
MTPRAHSLDRREFLKVSVLGTLSAAALTAGGKVPEAVVGSTSRQPSCSADGAADEGRWRSYEVYEPVIERYFICDPAKEVFQYNHCSAIVFFKSRWIAVWNANREPDEAKPGQLICMSTSLDGKKWSTPEISFASKRRSNNPILCSHVQWQPGLVIVDGALWCFWSQLSFKDGVVDEGYGAYFSVLEEPDGKWTNRRLLWDGSPDAHFDERRFRIFVQGNPTRLSRGRVLVPVCLMGKTERRARGSPFAADDLGQYREVRNSVLYSDDRGETWKVSPGTVLPGLEWGQWEPSVVEQPDGDVRMIARSSLGPRPAEIEIRSETIVTATSRDGGATWSPLETVPIESVLQRPQVVRMDFDHRQPPAKNGRFLALHVDNRQVLGNARDRQPLSLYFKRGGGYEFEAGNAFTADEAVVHYPQMFRQQNKLLVSYTHGVGLSGIKVAHIDPLPDPERYYIFPRHRLPPDSIRPKVAGDWVRFFPNQYVVSKSVPRLDPEGFSAVAWLRFAIHGRILGTYDPENGGGFDWAIVNGRASFQAQAAGRTGPDHGWTRYAKWSQVGITVDIKKREVRFYTDGREVGRKPLPSLTTLVAEGQSATVGGPSRGVPGILGDIRYLALISSPMSKDEHASFYKSLARDLGRSEINRPAATKPIPCLEFDSSRPERLSRDFEFPANMKAGIVESAVRDGLRVLRLYGEISAGLDLDANSRNHGDQVHLRFRFRHLTGERYVVCTIGDSRVPLRLVKESGSLQLINSDSTEVCGQLKTGWNTVAIETGGDTTTISLNSGRAQSVRHSPKGTWVYLGQGYREGSYPIDSAFEIDVSSVTSMVQKYFARESHKQP